MGRPAASPLSKGVGMVIKGAIQKKGIKQVDLAARVGISTVHMSMLLNGKSEFSLTMAQRMLSEIGIELRLVDPEADRVKKKAKR